MVMLRRYYQELKIVFDVVKISRRYLRFRNASRQMEMGLEMHWNRSRFSELNNQTMNHSFPSP